MSKLKSYIKNVLIGIDQLGGAIILGDPDETISSRLGKAHRGDNGKIWYGITYLPWLVVNCVFYWFDGWGHCESSIEEDEGQDDIDIRI